MVLIKYAIAGGRVKEVEVKEEFKREYEKMQKNERRIERKETRRHLSLEMLMEQEERQNTQGYWENQSFKRNQETYSLVSSELDPLEILIQREEAEKAPVMKALSLGLTEYQQKIAVQFYINNKTHTQIAEEFKITRQGVGNVIKKVQKKVLDSFI